MMSRGLGLLLCKRRSQLLQSTVPVVLGLGALGRLISPDAAQAQCIGTSNPPASAAIDRSFANQTFDQATPFDLFTVGELGCASPDEGVNTNGRPGFGGQAAGGISVTATNVTVTGASTVTPGGASRAVTLSSRGGDGGRGGNGGNPFSNDTRGGDGGAGGRSGDIVLSFSGVLRAGSAGLGATEGIFAPSVGGNGANGGETGTCCNNNQTGGDGGAGGAAGSVRIRGSGDATVVSRLVFATASGGRGGNGGSLTTSDAFAKTLRGGAGGIGGAGANADVTWTGGTTDSAGVGFEAYSEGGPGGAGGVTGASSRTEGGAGGAGGAAGAASVSVENTVIKVREATAGVRTGAIVAVAEGGGGGAGGQAGSALSVGGGSGGAGGNGGTASASLAGSGITFSAFGAEPGQAIFVSASGGRGGAGGVAGGSAGPGQAGGGGLAGKGGSAALTVGNASAPVTIDAAGRYGNVAVVQSIGGGGGSGGKANFNGSGGEGAVGGDGGGVKTNIVNSRLITRGASAGGLIAQSIGGGGGIGGDSEGIVVGLGFAVGGNGGSGGLGGDVGVTLGAKAVVASLDMAGNGGVLAQSIGGAGGLGGSARVTGSGVIALTVGGTGGSGGVAGTVALESVGLVATMGDHAAGLHAQSIGGGGGKGGSAFSFNAGLLPTASVAVGGKGGEGGTANAATINNAGQVTTFGSDAFGIIAQSVGGGGGMGGAAVARGVSISPTEQIPSFSVSVATGGSGGKGNKAGAATVVNSGFVATAGEGARAVVAQSVGGGGGAGGDSTAASYTGQQFPGVTLTVSVGVGGTGGEGGHGGQALATNKSLLLTMGADAYGLMAQSVGGGGGIGGAGDTTSASGLASAGVGVGISVGGKGGSGGIGGAAKAINEGGIATGGDGSDGMFVQSVGGGGGAGGGGVASGNGDSLSINMGIGGDGGNGGDGSTVDAQNTGAVVTRGTDAVGIFAQSVGGGGGKGGKGGATSGGSSPLGQTKNLFDALANGLNIEGKGVEVIDGIFEYGEFAEESIKTGEEIGKIIKQLQGKNNDVFEAKNLDVAISVGGKGGAAGKGDAVSVTNVGQIITFGAQSDGIYAQSIGGGGGSGGAASSTSKSVDDGRNQTAIAVGGSGGGGGDGGAVSVANAGGASILTRGILGIGLYAQSVGGGGGEAAMGGALSGSLRSLSVGVGGNGGSGGNGGTVNVTAGDSVTASSIRTTGKHSIAIFAQSVGGGGGLVRTMTVDSVFDPDEILENPQGRLFDVHGYTMQLGGRNGIAGTGGTVNVTLGGSVATEGLNAHGILAQSIGGGGGLISGGQLEVPGGGNGGDGRASGNGGEVSIRLKTLARIETSGAGAYGILGQSIGGGGGVAGDLSAVSEVQQGTSLAVKRSAGNAAGVLVDLANAGIKTTGDFAPAIFAQSVGGGGGLVNFDFVSGGQKQSDILVRGTAGGDGNGGAVTVVLNNTSVVATGRGSYGIFAQSDGKAADQIKVSMDKTSLVQGGVNATGAVNDTAAIVLLGGVNNQISIEGTVRGDAVSADGGTAIRALGARTGSFVTNTGTITGNIFLDPGTLINNQGGTIVSRLLNVGFFKNAGTLDITLGAAFGESRIYSAYEQAATGRLIVAADLKAGRANVLNVDGRAALAGTIELRTSTVSTQIVTILRAKDIAITSPLTVTSASPLFSFETNLLDNELRIVAQAKISAAAASYGSNSRQVADNLQALFDAGARFDAGFTALAGFTAPAADESTFGTLSGQGLGAIGAYRFQASNGFVEQLFGGCSAFDTTGAAVDPANCAWARIIGGQAVQDSTADADGYRSTGGVFQLGAQRQIAEHGYISGSLAYEMSQFNSNDATTKMTGDGLLGGLHLRYHRGGLQVSGAIDGGYSWFDSRRVVAVGNISGVAQGEPQAWHVGFHARAAWQSAEEGAYVKPFVDFHAVRVQTSAFAEQGLATFGLAVDSQAETALAGGAGVEIGSRMALAGGVVVRPFVSAAYQALGNNDWATTARFIDQPQGPGFTVVTPAPDQLGRFAVGVDVMGSPTVDMSFQYMPVVGSGYTSHAGAARLSVRF